MGAESASTPISPTTQSSLLERSIEDCFIAIGSGVVGEEDCALNFRPSGKLAYTRGSSSSVVGWLSTDR